MLRERDGRAGLDLRAEHEPAEAAGPVGRVGDAARRLAALVPWFVTVRVTARPAPSGTAVADASNGPIPESANRPATARMTMNRMIPPIAIPWTCELAESRRPSGLQRSHRPTSMATGAPHRTHACIGAGLAAVAVAGDGSRRGHGPDGATMTTRPATTSRPRPAPTSGRSPRPARRRRRSSGPGRSRRRRRPPASAPRSRAAPSTHGEPSIDSSLSQSPWNPTITRWSSRRRPVAASDSR